MNFEEAKRTVLETCPSELPRFFDLYEVGLSPYVAASLAVCEAKFGLIEVNRKDVP